MHLVEPAEGTFTREELARLKAYRAAVAAGFYSDWEPGTKPEPSPSDDSDAETEQKD